MALYTEAWFIVVLISVVLFIIALIGFVLSSNQNDVSAWIWVVSGVSLVLVIVSFVLYGMFSGKTQCCSKTIIIKKQIIESSPRGYNTMTRNNPGSDIEEFTPETLYSN